MNRPRMRVLGLAFVLAPAACTADFFVGPLGGSSKTAEDSGDSGPSSATSAPPGTTGDDASTTQTPTTQDPDLSTSSTSGESTTTGAETTEGTTLSTESTTGTSTEEPADCIPKGAPACEEAFPGCLWNGEECTVNLCNVGDQKTCLTEAPECIWEGGGCIPSECGEETECGALEPAACEKTKGCVLVGLVCFVPACVPCAEVESIPVCNDLPNCAYNEGREACLPQ